MSTKTAVIYIRVTPEVRNAAETRARSQDRTIPDYIRHLIAADLRDNPVRETRTLPNGHTTTCTCEDKNIVRGEN